jgi:N-acetylmuramoyl-L-alanine amidase
VRPRATRLVGGSLAAVLVLASCGDASTLGPPEAPDASQVHEEPADDAGEIEVEETSEAAAEPERTEESEPEQEVEPEPELEPEPEPDPTDEAVREAQALLGALGYPAGPIDGLDGQLTRRGLCIWRSLDGREAARDPLRDGELDLLRATAGLPAAPPGRGVRVDRTCQALAYRDGGQWQSVHAASTGTDGLPSVGDYRIVRKVDGWHTSTLYPAPEPNMYNPMYIAGAIAIHGSNHVPPSPASAGCVRVTPEVADHLFARLQIGDPVQVVGAY